MKKILALMLALIMVLGIVASCTPQNNDTSTTQPKDDPQGPTCNIHTDMNGDNVCDDCGVVIHKEDDSTPDPDDSQNNGGSSNTTATQKPDDTTTSKPDGTETSTSSSTSATTQKPVEDTPVTGTIDVLLAGYSFETIYFEWKPLKGADSYNVYCDGKKVDTELIRNYGSHYRCDILGLKAGAYTIDVYAVDNGQEVADSRTSFTRTTIAHVREGFGFVGGSASGAYNDDGTLKSNAQVIYVTAANAKTVTANVNGALQTGLQTILDAKQKANTSNDVLCIRIIGMISASDMDHFSSSSEGLQIKGKAAYTDMNITIEGVGNDATINGFGFLLRNCKNVEIRNIAIMNFMDDGISVDTDNCNLWLHNIDFFYGQAGGDSDQNKGDGSLDIKKSQYITVSYNHFFDSGKCCLLDASTGNNADYISYHHNWFDHSDSRHPRVRNANVHVYNNYYDGVSKYGIGAAGGGSSVFSEANYFENTKYPMLTSMQGSDIAGDGEGTFSGEDGGVIKSFGDVIVGGTFRPYSSTNTVEYDAYVAASRNEALSSSIASKQGGHTYSNFDTADDMYSYNPHTAEQARENVIAFAGRVQGGDFKWTFTDADDASYEINSYLQAAINNYESSLVSTNVGNTSSGGNSGNGNGGTDTPVVTPTPEGAIVHNFHESGKTSSFFTINGNLSSSKGTVTYNGLSLTQCLKIESSTSITFTLTEARTLTLVFNPSSDAGDAIKINGTSYDLDSNAILTVELQAGSYSITKDDSIFLYYIILE